MAEIIMDACGVWFLMAAAAIAWLIYLASEAPYGE